MTLSPVMLAALVGAVLAGMVVALMMIGTPRTAMPVLAGMVFVSALAVHRDDFGHPSNHTWVYLLQIYRAELFIALAVLMLIGVVVHLGRLRGRAVPVQALLLIGIQVYGGLIGIYHAGPAFGVSRIAFATFGFGAVMLMMIVNLDEWEDWLRPLRAIGLGLALWIGATIIQLGINPSEMLVQYGTRFTGLHGNPQGTAIFLGPASVVAVWLALNDTKRVWRMVWMASAVAGALFIVWTGSRTGALLLFIGLTASLYGRLGRAILLMPLLAIFVWIALKLVAPVDTSIDYSRIISTSNTRAGAWSALLHDAFRSPIFGIPWSESHANENSYLISLVLFGVGGLALVLTLLFYSIWLMLRVWRLRSGADPHWKRLIELIVAYNTMFFAGAMFEWYIVARFESNLLFLLVFSTMAAALLQRAAVCGLHGGFASTEVMGYEPEQGQWQIPAEGQPN